MEIDLKTLPEAEQVTLLASEEPGDLDLGLSGVRVVQPIEIKAEMLKIQDALDIRLNLKSKALMQCSRCLAETELNINKDVRLDYSVGKDDTAIDISGDIREEIILEYPLQPLCSPACKGLCPECGKNLNEGSCSCKYKGGR